MTSDEERKLIIERAKIVADAKAKASAKAKTAPEATPTPAPGGFEPIKAAPGAQGGPPAPGPAPVVPGFTPAPTPAPEPTTGIAQVGGVGGYAVPLPGPSIVPPGAKPTLPPPMPDQTDLAMQAARTGRTGRAPTPPPGPLGVGLSAPSAAPLAELPPEPTSGPNALYAGPTRQTGEVAPPVAMMQSAYNTLHHVSSDLWTGVADIVGLPAEAVKQSFGIAGSQIMQGAEPTEAVKKALRSLGWMNSSTEQDNIVDRVIQKLPIQGLELAAIMSGAGLLANATKDVTKVVPGTLNAVAEWLMAKPAAQIAGTVGATAGGQLAHEAHPAGENDFAWTMLGSILGAGGMGALYGVAKATANRTFVPWYKTLTTPMASEAVVPVKTYVPGAGRVVTGHEAMGSIEDALQTTHDDVMLRSKDKVNQALDSFKGIGTPDQEANQFYSLMHEAADYARTRVTELLSKTKMGLKVPSYNVMGIVSRISRNKTGSLGALSPDVKGLIAKMNETPPLPAGSTAPPNPATAKVESLINLRDKAQAELNAMRWGNNPDLRPNGPMQASNQLLIDAIDADLVTGVPPNAAAQIKTALGIKKDLTRLFDSGPLGKMFRTDPNGRPALIPADVMNEMHAGATPVPQGGGLPDLLSAPKSLDEIDRFYTDQIGSSNPPPPAAHRYSGGRPPIAVPVPPPSQQVVDKATQLVAAEFKKVLGDPSEMLQDNPSVNGVPGGPNVDPGMLGGMVKRGQDFMKRYETLVTNLGNAWAQLQQPLDALGNEHMAVKQHIATAVARAIGKDADAAIEDVFDINTGSGVQKARQLTRAVAHDPEAAYGLKFGIMQHFWKDTFGNAQTGFTGSSAWAARAATALNNPTTRRIYIEVLGTKVFGRFESIIKDAIALNNAQRGVNVRGLRRYIPAGMVVRSISAMMGASAGRALNTGTIQVPGRMSMLFQSVAGGFFKSAVPAVEMLNRALLDPRWERILHVRAPETAAEVESLRGLIREMIRAPRTIARGATIYEQNQEDQNQ